MKTNNLLAIIILVLFSMIGGQGCSKTEDPVKGSIDFGMNQLLESALKSVDIEVYDISGALVSVLDENGQMVYDKEFLNFYAFGESFVTEKLSLTTGRYSLSEFLLLGADGNIIWATPLENSELAYLVDDPLPMHFKIEPNITTHIRPQVVWVGNQNPGDFGYVSFSVDFVDRFCIGIEFISECLDWYMTMDSTYGPDGSFAPVYPARLLVFSGDKLIMEAPLSPGYNSIFLPRGYRSYTLVAEDCYMEPCFKQIFPAEELLKFSCRQGEALFINCAQIPPNIVVTPEDVKEPTIKQGVFGMISMPYSDSTFTEEYRTMPVVRDMEIYKIGDNDPVSAFFESEGCSVYPITDMAPYATVRSNSSGYYQLKLEAGRYLYMILTENGYYIDLYLSSRIPGELIIREGQVTIQNIVITPCYWTIGADM